MVARRQVEGGSELGRVLWGLSEAFVEHRSDESAAQRTAAIVPRDGRAGVEERAAVEAGDHVAGRDDVNELGPDRQHSFERGRIRSNDIDARGEGGERSLGPRSRRMPAGSSDSYPLGFERVREQVDADGRNDRFDIEERAQ
jgi:hypothetical protein